MTLYGYARVSVREPEDKNLGLVVEGDTLMVTHIDRLSRGWGVKAHAPATLYTPRGKSQHQR